MIKKITSQCFRYTLSIVFAFVLHVKLIFVFISSSRFLKEMVYTAINVNSLGCILSSLLLLPLSSLLVLLLLSL